MGQSAKAILAFGFDLGDDIDAFPEILLDEDRGLDLEKVILEDAGIIRPDSKWLQSPEWQSYFFEKKQAIADYPVDIIFHCDFDYGSCYFLAIRGTEIDCYAGDVKPIKPSNLISQITEGDLQKFRNWCEAKNIPYKQPEWCLMSIYG